MAPSTSLPAVTSLRWLLGQGFRHPRRVQLAAGYCPPRFAPLANSFAWCRQPSRSSPGCLAALMHFPAIQRGRTGAVKFYRCPQDVSLGAPGRQRVAASLLLSRAGVHGEHLWLGKAALDARAKQPLHSEGFHAKQMVEIGQRKEPTGSERCALSSCSQRQRRPSITSATATYYLTFY